MARLLHHYVMERADVAPEDVAVAMGDDRLTYGELNDLSDRLAALLRATGCQRHDRICLFTPKSLDAVVAILGTLKADCVYVPIDVASPAARVSRIVEAADPQLVLVASEAVSLFDCVATASRHPPLVGSLDGPMEGMFFTSAFSRDDWETFDKCAPRSPNRSGDPAHILFTSGSTGTPKGVVITHANVIAFVEWATRHFGIRPTDRNSSHPPLHFDLSTFDLYATFAAGAQLHLVPPSASVLPHRLAKLIRASELTQWFSVPSTMAYMAKFGVIGEGDFPSLERVIWCGEVLPTPVLIHWMKRLPHASFTNLYGPTEATIASSYYTVRAIPATPTDPIPIGTPCAGEDLLILDENLVSVAPGEIGDLYIAGDGLSPGYWRDAEKTREVFRADPADPARRIYKTGDLARADDNGLVYFLGRKDSQIKHRGYRIELGEIEAAISALGLVGESAVVAVPTDGFEGTTICCAFACLDGADVAADVIRAALLPALPAYMIPSRWLSLATLPKNANGKIDRRALRDTFTHDDAALTVA